MQPIDRDDPVASLADLVDPKFGKFEETADGYTKYIPSPEELEGLNARFAEEINQAKQDHEGFFAQIKANIETYRARPTGMRAGDKNPVITLPIVGRQIDNSVAYEVVSIMKPRPIVSFDPYFNSTYKVPAMMEDPEALMQMGQMMGMQGGMMAPPMPMEVEYTAEEVARAWEAGFDYKLREKLDGRRLFKAIAKDIRIAGYAVVKNVWDRQTYSVTTPEYAKAPEGWIQVVGEREHELVDGEPNKFVPVSPFSFLMPMDEDNVQRSPWISEDTPEDPTSFRENLGTEYTLIPKDEWETAAGMTTDEYRQTSDRAVRESVDKRKAQRPSKKHDIKDVWFFYPVRLKEPGEDGKTRTRLRNMSFLGKYHMGLQKFLCIYKNPYRHGKRPYVVFFEDEEAHRLSTVSMVERVGKHQKLISQALHLDFQNAVQANNFNYYVDPDSEAWPVLTNGDNYPGKVIPRRDEKEVETKQAGVNHPGLANIVAFLGNDLAETTGENQYKMGQMIPNRTAASTVSQIMEAGYLKPLMTMQAVSDCFAELVRMWLSTQSQYAPFGEIVPTRDEETNELIEVPFRFPMEPVFSNFRIALTAADEELAKEADTAETIMLSEKMAESGLRVMQIVGAMASPEVSPAITAIFEDLLGTENEFRKMLMKAKRSDIKKFALDTKKIKSVLEEKQQALMMQQQMMMEQQAAMGGMGGGMAGPEAPLPENGQAPVGGGMVGMAGPPVDGGVPAGL